MKQAPERAAAFLQAARSVVESHLRDDLSVEDFAHALFLTRVQLFRKLKGLTGLSPTHFIHKIKLEKALQLLQATPMTIAEAAYSVGFADPKYFSRVFAATFGATPSAFVEKSRELFSRVAAIVQPEAGPQNTGSPKNVTFVHLGPDDVGTHLPDQLLNATGRPPGEQTFQKAPETGKMSGNNPCSEANLRALASFLDRNATTDFSLANLDDEPTINSLNWTSSTEKKNLRDCLRAFQRLVKIMPGLSRPTALALLGKGVHSALQIAAMPKIKFLNENRPLFQSEAASVEQFYASALAIRGEILLQYMAVKQSNEPHARAARL